jgi:hypothetical protein
LLKRIRFIVGEYHGFDRFTAVMRNKLFQTHKVNSSATRSSAASSPNAATKAATASCTTAGCQCRCRG